MSPVVLSYAGAYLDRAEHRRTQPDWLAARRHDATSRLLPVWRGQGLVVAAADGVLLPRPALHEHAGLVALADTLVFLGLEGGEAVFAADVSTCDAGTVAAHLPADGSLADLRDVGAQLPAADAHLLAYARALLHWHRQHRYCGRCGAPTTVIAGGHRRRCRDDGCGREHYPRTDPAVIMLVTRARTGGRPAQCLLAHHRRFTGQRYSTLAGFVEPGESLEEAVVREVHEEVGLTVTAPRYTASQPWPFPGQIMLGFEAEAPSAGRVRVDGDEILHADWFTAEAVLSAGDWGDDSAGIQLPRHDSIARFLITNWARRQQ